MFTRRLLSLKTPRVVPQYCKWNFQRTGTLYHSQKYNFSGVNPNVPQQIVSKISEVGQSTSTTIPQIENISSTATAQVNIEDINKLTNTGDVNISNIAETVNPISSSITHDFFDKLSFLSLKNMYYLLDESSRDTLLYLSNDMGLGMGISIAVISLGIKIFFMPITIAQQVDSLKMKLLEPEYKNYQDQMRRYQKLGDHNSASEAAKQFSQLKKNHGLSNWVSLAALTQIPVLITWFLSLRYITSMPDKFPQLQTDGMLWFQNLADQDPYCILPVMVATFGYLNISMNSKKEGNEENPLQNKMRNLKYLPFATLPVIIFFPSALNLYIAIATLSNLIMSAVIRNQRVRSLLGIPKYLPGTILERLNLESVQKTMKTVITDDIIVNNVAGSTDKITPLSSASKITKDIPKITLSSSISKKILTKTSPISENNGQEGDEKQDLESNPEKK